MILALATIARRVNEANLGEPVYSLMSLKQEVYVNLATKFVVAPDFVEANLVRIWSVLSSCDDSE